MQYRPEIDGLRSLAVLSVVFFHAGFEVFSGGFVGVDIFFVISGFLISGIIIDDVEQDRFSLVLFYERRIRRIFPALFLMVLICLPVAWLLLLPEDLARFFKSLIAVSIFTSNLHFAGESGYFDTAVELKPLLHTWSLAVEEQYYIFFPFFIVYLWKRQKVLFQLVVFLFAVSLAVSVWRVNHMPEAAFYWLSSRIWEFFVGFFASVFVRKNYSFPGYFISQAASFSGLVIIILVVILYDKDTPFPGLYAIPPVIGTALIIMFVKPSTFVYQILAHRFFVSVGLISYSLYLWHQPVFVFFKYTPLDMDFFATGTLCLLSFILAFLSWRYVEQPFRHGKIRSGFMVFSMAGCAALVFLFVGLAGKYTSGFESLWLSGKSQEQISLYHMIKDSSETKDSVIDDHCKFNFNTLNEEFMGRVESCFGKYGKGILVIGDSHAEDLYRELSTGGRISFIASLASGGCRVHEFKKKCSFPEIPEYLAKYNSRFSAVVYEQAAFYLFKDKYGHKGTRSMFFTVPLDGRYDGISVDSDSVNVVAEYLGVLAGYNRVVWFGSRLEPHITDSMIMARGCSYDYKLRENQHDIFDALDDDMESIVEKYPGLVFYSQNEMYKFSFPEDFMNCNNIFWSDGDHFSAEGERYFGSRFDVSILGF